jgi:hypothetical protein
MTTPAKSIYDEILDWSPEKPAWWRDALRRLVQGNEVLDSDVDELPLICKSAHGIRPQGGSVPSPIPLAQTHIPSALSATTQISLVSVPDAHNVNALADGHSRC